MDKKNIDWKLFLKEMSNENDIPTSRWFYLDNIEIYLRAGPNYYNWEKARFVTVSNVEVKENIRGTGIFSSLLKDIQSEAVSNKYSFIIIENVIEKRFADYFFKQGFVKRKESDIRLPMSLIKKL